MSLVSENRVEEELERPGPYDAMTFAGTALVVGGGAVLMTSAAALGTWRVDPLAALKMA